MIEENCSICFATYEFPVVLPCKHIFCQDCISQALNNSQSCPMCRRLTCNLLQDSWPLLGETTPEKPNEGLPCFVYRIALPFNSTTEFNFFEKRYVAMINEALKSDLTFLIDPQVDGCCYKVRLQECLPLQQQQVYVCQVLNVQRVKIVSQSFREIPNSENKLKYCVVEGIEDQLNEDSEQLYQQFLSIVEKLSTKLELSAEDRSAFIKNFSNQTSISEKSLDLLSSLKIPENTFLKYYFSGNVNARLEIVIKHFESFLQYYSA